MLFTWKYDYAAGGAVVHAVPADGSPVEVARVNNGNVAQILCDALAAQHSGEAFTPRQGPNDARPEAMMTWLGYVNPPRSSREDTYDACMLRTQEGEAEGDDDENERRWLRARGLY